MRRLPLAFFSAASLCATGGMVWGAMMGASQDFALAPAHAHLNLVGWASLALMGVFYQLSGRGGRLGWINFGLSTLGVVVFIPSLAMELAGVKGGDLGLVVGPLLALLGMLTFLGVVLSTWRTPAAA